MDFKDYYATLESEDSLGQGTEAGVTSWRASTIRTSMRATRPLSRFKKSTKPYEVLGDPRS